MFSFRTKEILWRVPPVSFRYWELYFELPGTLCLKRS